MHAPQSIGGYSPGLASWARIHRSWNNANTPCRFTKIDREKRIDKVNRALAKLDGRPIGNRNPKLESHREVLYPESGLAERLLRNLQSKTVALDAQAKRDRIKQLRREVIYLEVIVGLAENLAGSKLQAHVRTLPDYSARIAELRGLTGN